MEEEEVKVEGAEESTTAAVAEETEDPSASKRDIPSCKYESHPLVGERRRGR